MKCPQTSKSKISSQFINHKQIYTSRYIHHLIWQQPFCVCFDSHLLLFSVLDSTRTGSVSRECAGNKLLRGLSDNDVTDDAILIGFGKILGG